MSIQIVCGGCGATYAVSEVLAGKTARCKCGAKIKIPAPSPIMPESLDGLFDELPAPAEAPTLAPRKSLAAASPGANPLSKVFEGGAPSVLKLGAGAVVGALVGLKAIFRDDDRSPLDPGLRIPIVAMFAVIGALVASLLVVADIVRKRRKKNLYVPLVLRLYFGGRWLTLMLWIATIFVIVIAWL